MLNGLLKFLAIVLIALILLVVSPKLFVFLLGIGVLLILIRLGADIYWSWRDRGNW